MSDITAGGVGGHTTAEALSPGVQVTHSAGGLSFVTVEVERVASPDVVVTGIVVGAPVMGGHGLVYRDSWRTNAQTPIHGVHLDDENERRRKLAMALSAIGRPFVSLGRVDDIELPVPVDQWVGDEVRFGDIPLDVGSVVWVYGARYTLTEIQRTGAAPVVFAVADGSSEQRPIHVGHIREVVDD